MFVPLGSTVPNLLRQTICLLVYVKSTSKTEEKVRIMTDDMLASTVGHYAPKLPDIY